MKVVTVLDIDFKKLSKKEIEAKLKAEFSVDSKVALKRVVELKKLFIEFEDDNKIKIVKEMIYSYINDQPLATIAVASIINEMLLEELLDELKGLIDTSNDPVKLIAEGLYGYIKNDKLTAGLKIKILRSIKMNEESREIIEKMEKINEIRNDYMHIKFLKNKDVTQKLDFDTKTVVKYVFEILSDLRPARKEVFIGRAVANPNKFLKL